MPKPKQPSLSEALSEALDSKRPKRATVAALGVEDEPEQVAPPNPPSRGVTPRDPARPVAPKRDFNKRANSLDKLALPAGIFPGSSKSLYDALYVRTRGAIVPVRSIRATKRELSEWSGIRNVKTIDSHLRYFSAVGLVVSEWERGQNDGALYEVLLPEETRGLFVGSRGVTPPNPTSPHLTPPDATSPQNSESPQHQNLGSPHLTDLAIESTTSENSKTSLILNTDKSDDEAAPPALRELERELTGKNAPADKWAEVWEVLITELRIAAGRTTVSSVPAFLAEHLRRRLFKDRAKLEALAKDVPQGQGTQGIDIRECPDCKGNGHYFLDDAKPETFRLCRHEKLASKSE